MVVLHLVSTVVLSFSAFHGEADFDGHLPVFHLSLVDIAARFDHLKPAQVLDGFVRPLDGLVHGVLDGSGGGAGEFDEIIDVVLHGWLPGKFILCPVFKTVDPSDVVFREQMLLGLQPVLHIVPGQLTLVHITVVCASGHFVC